MFFARFKRLTAMVLGLVLLGAAGGSAAQSGTDYSAAHFVQISLGTVNREQGLTLLGDQPDGLSLPTPDGMGRQAMSNAADSDRYFYFDVDESYVNGGKNHAILTISYQDLGFTPIYLEYDSFDPVRPNSTALEVTRKRVELGLRTNTEGWKSIFVTLYDARFAGHLPGGADFRIGSADDLVLRNVSVRRVAHEVPLAPPRVMIDGVEIQFDPDDVQPYIDPLTNRTLVPIRAMANALGIPDTDIKWDNETRTVELKKQQTVILLTIDSKQALVNYVPVAELDQPAVIMASRTFVPLRFVTETFGLTVNWDSEQRLITLTSLPVASEPSPTPNQGPDWLFGSDDE